VIYIIRNPRDVSVSGYFFWEKMNICKIAKSWDEYFEWFIQGNGECAIKCRRWRLKVLHRPHLSTFHAYFPPTFVL
jgi:hypothetical protein